MVFCLFLRKQNKKTTDKTLQCYRYYIYIIYIYLYIKKKTSIPKTGILQAPQYILRDKILPPVYLKSDIRNTEYLISSRLILTSRNFSQNPIVSYKVQMVTEIFESRNYFCYHLQLNSKSNFTVDYYTVPACAKITFHFFKKIMFEYKTRKKVSLHLHSC